MTTTDWWWVAGAAGYSALFWVVTLRVVAWLDRRGPRG